MEFTYNNRTYRFQRYPASDNRSLRPWSAADEHILNYLEEQGPVPRHPIICHDRFGFLTVLLHQHRPYFIVTQKSQEKALFRNLIKNSLTAANLPIRNPLMPLKRRIKDATAYEPLPVELALMKVPKSLDLFRLYLYQLSRNLTSEAKVICGFMTRHFTKQMLEIAASFFESVEQSKAWKKSRLLILSQPKPFVEQDLMQTVRLDENTTLQQYPGVFSASKIDMATRFLLGHLRVKVEEKRVLDLGCGNGVLGLEVLRQNPEAELHLLDDSILAVESAKLNMTSIASGRVESGQSAEIGVSDGKTGDQHFHWEDSLRSFPDDHFDLVVCNPPFHFEHEIDISVPLRLLKEVERCLKPSGRLLMVANWHLNYKIHLEKWFEQVTVIAKNKKFGIYQAD